MRALLPALLAALALPAAAADLDACIDSGRFGLPMCQCLTRTLAPDQVATLLAAQALPRGDKAAVETFMADHPDFPRIVRTVTEQCSQVRQ